MDRGNLYCGVIYLSHRLKKPMPDMYDYTMKDLYDYVVELEQELIERGSKK